MEYFKIKDFNTAFEKGVENLVKDAVCSMKDKKKVKKLKFDETIAVLKDKILPQFGIESENISTERLQYAMKSLIDPSKMKEGKEPKIKVEALETLIHRFYYDQLRLEAEHDPVKEEMLYANAQVIKEVNTESPELEATINSTELFDCIDLKSIAVRDNGVMKVENGSAVNKKFKYFNNNPNEILNIEVFSNMPSVICVKTPTITIPSGGFDLIKFLVLAPQTPCLIDAKILIRNAATKKDEELILFRLDVD